MLASVATTLLVAVGCQTSLPVIGRAPSNSHDRDERPHVTGSRGSSFDSDAPTKPKTGTFN